MRGRATSDATIGPIVTNSRYCNHNQLFGCIRWSFLCGLKASPSRGDKVGTLKHESGALIGPEGAGQGLTRLHAH